MENEYSLVGLSLYFVGKTLNNLKISALRFLRLVRNK